MTGAFQGLFALMNRSLQSEDRSLRTHLWRFGFVAFSYAMLIGSQRTIMVASAPGLEVFRAICYLNFHAVTVAAVSFFASAVTEEKEEMTLGLLKMAGVSPLALLLGKSTPRLITAMVLLTAQLPFTMLAVTLGGVSLNQVLSAYACLFAYLVFTANLALFFSVICRRSRNAGLFTGLVLFAYFSGPYWAMVFRMGMTAKGWWNADGWFETIYEFVRAKVELSSAYTRIGNILSTGFTDSPISYQVIVNLILGGGCLLLAWLCFEPATRNERPASEERGLLSRRIGSRSRIFGADRAWNWALSWKDFHFIGGGRLMMLLKFIVYFGVLGLMLWTNEYYGGGMRARDFGAIAFWLGIVILVTEVTIQASRIFYTEVKWKTLSSIMLLPKSTSEIAYTKLLGAALSLTPVLCVLIVGFLCAPEEIGNGILEFLDEPVAWYMLSQVILMIHFAALLSLHLKWGALPLAFAATYGSNMLFFFFASLFFRFRGPPEGLMGLLAIVTLIGCGFTHYLIGIRLRKLAAN